MALTGVVVIALGALTVGVALQQREAAQGMVVVSAGGRQASTLGPTTVALHDASGWVGLGRTRRSRVAAAAAPAQLLQEQVPAGRYDAIMVGRREFQAPFQVTPNLVTPILLQVQEGRALSVYAGQDQVSLGEQELAGRLPAVPSFDLVNEDGRPFTNASIAGRTVVLAAFEAGSHQAGPLVTGLFRQLQPHLPRGTMLVEVSVDPWADTPAVLREYARQTGSGWTLATGPAAAVGAFWKPFGVQLSAADISASTLVVIDQHGYVRATYQGIPDVADLPATLRARLNATGEAELRQGDGWGQAQVLTSVGDLQRLVAQAPSGGRPAKAFSGANLRGAGSVSLAQFRGSPVVINFFASYCGPCRSELPMLQRSTDQSGVKLLLVDERDSSAPALSLLRQTGATAPAVADPSGGIGGLYGVQDLPDTFYVFGDGTLEGSTLGELTQSVLSLNLRALRAGPD